MNGILAACDVGLLFLDHRFTISNFPSRLLSYMQAGLPVLACTDPNTDVGKIVTEGGFGWWRESKDVEDFASLVRVISQKELSSFSEKSKIYLHEHYDVTNVYESIVGSINVK